MQRSRLKLCVWTQWWILKCWIWIYKNWRGKGRGILKKQYYVFLYGIKEIKNPAASKISYRSNGDNAVLDIGIWYFLHYLC
jgi:hypothetical protein